jgi:hypothetical protein
MSDGIMKMTCHLDDYTVWDDILDEQVKRFRKKWSIYPNIALSAKETWEKIDSAANFLHPENIGRPAAVLCTGETEHEFSPISGLTTPDYRIEFCIEEKGASDYITLIFDEDPTFDGEPLEDQTVFCRSA